MSSQLPDYDALIENLLSCKYAEEVINQLINYDNLLDKGLINRLIECQVSVGNQVVDQKLSWLLTVIKEVFEQVCFRQLLFLNREDAFQFAQDHFNELLTDNVFQQCQQLLFDKTRGKISEQGIDIEYRYDMLASIAAFTWIERQGDWDSQRLLLLNGFNWLQHPTADDIFQSYAQQQSNPEETVAMLRELIDQSAQRSSEAVVREVDLQDLLIQLEYAQGEHRVALLIAASDLIQAYQPEDWALLQLDLGATYQLIPSENRAELLERSIDCFKAALTVFTPSNDPQHWAMAYNNLGVVYQERIKGDRNKNVQAAIDAYHNVETICNPTQFPDLWAATQNNLGNLYRQKSGGHWATNQDIAIAYYHQALRVYTKEELPQDWALTMTNLGSAYLERLQGESTLQAADWVENAIGCYHLALEIRTQNEFPIEWAETQHNIGNAYRYRTRGNKAENMEQAIAAFQQALLVRSRPQFPQEWAITLNDLGNAYRERIRGEQGQNIEEAIAHYQQALTVSTRAQFPRDWAMTQHNLGGACLERVRGNREDNLEEAINHYQLALQVFTQEHYPEQWAELQNNLGNTYRDRIRDTRTSNLETALSYYQQALDVRTRQHLPLGWAATLNNLGNVYADRSEGTLTDNQEMAIVCYQQALEIRTRQQFPADWAMTKNNLGNIYASRIQGNRDENIQLAITCYQEALEIRTPEQFALECLETRLNLANLYYDERQWSRARVIFESAHEVIELIRNETLRLESRQRIAQGNAYMYARLIRCCLLLSDTTAAAEYAFTMKSRSMLELMASNSLAIDEGLTEEIKRSATWQSVLRQREFLAECLAQLNRLPDGDELSAETKEQKFTLGQQIRMIRQQINQETDNLLFQHPSLAAVKAVPPLRVSQAQRLSLVLSHCPLIEYISHDGGWGAFVITPSSVTYVPLRQDLANLIDQPLTDLVNDVFWSRADFRSRLIELFDLVFAPIRPYLPPSGPLVIAPTLGLHLVPFQALLNETDSFLCENYSLSFVPNLAMGHLLYEKRKETGSDKSAYSMLSVAYSGTGSRYLPNVLLEAQAIKAHFDDVYQLLEADATPERVLVVANQYTFDVIHINCHGMFDFTNPQLSGLWLAHEQLLPVNDIQFRLRFKGAPLVTLSACQTGQTRPEYGDETIGLSWAFLLAGASSIISSQWSVPDASTRLLFDAFYAIRRRPHLSSTEALQRAIALVRQKAAYRNRPQHWAAFQVMGLPIPD